MIELLARPSILKLNTTFASFIGDVQDAKYNPAYDPYEPGEMFVDDDDEPRYVSQEECDKWNREAQIAFNQKKDHIEATPVNFIDERIFSFPDSDIYRYIHKLSSGLEQMSAKLDWQAVIFLLDFPTPWLSQQNDYEPVKKALDYLQHIGVMDDFTGGFKASAEELKELVQHLFWITRCNASLPDCYFSGIHQDVVGNICKFGNIHFNFYSNTNRQEILKRTKEIGLKPLDENHCYDNFYDNGIIAGRRIIV